LRHHSSDATEQVLLVFLKEPVAGQVKTRLIPPLSPQEAAAIYAAMAETVLESVCNLGVKVVPCLARGGAGGEWSERVLSPYEVVIRQQGKTLGERLRNAFARAFEMGYGRIVCVGTDSPLVPREWLRGAFAALRENEMVLGPCTDGGYYLLGLRRPVGDLFRNIPWSSAHVLRRTTQRAERLGLRLSLLPPWFDVDEFRDVVFLRDYLLALKRSRPLGRAEARLLLVLGRTCRSGR